MVKNTVIIVLSILVVILGYFSISRNEKVVYDTKTKYDTVVTTKDTVIYKKVLKPFRVDSVRIDTFHLPADTMLMNAYKELVLAHLDRKYYVDTIYKDSLSHIILEEECYKNNIGNRKVFASMGSRTITKTVTIDRTPKWNIGVGVIGSVDLFAPSISVSHKNIVYLGGYDLLHHNMMVGVFYNFKF